MRTLQEIQKSLTYSIYETEAGYYQFYLIRSIINPMYFGSYGSLVQLAMEDDFLDKNNRSTEILKRGLGSLYIETLGSQFSTIQFFDDYIFLIKEIYLAEKEYESIKKLQDEIKFIEEKRAFDNSKNYLVRELYDDCMTELSYFQERKSQGKTLGYSYKFPILDKYTDGIQKGTVTRLNAYSNVGKSKFSYHVTNSLLDQGAHVIYFSLEVSKKRVIYNLIGNRYKKPMSEVYKMEFDDIDFGELFTKKLEVVDDKYTLQDILQYAEMRSPDAIIIDFVQNIQNKGSEYESLTDTAQKLQQIAIKQNIAVFDLSQVSNAGAQYVAGQAIPSKGSGALVASADVGLVLKRDKDVEGRLVLHIAKNKFGFNGKSIDYLVDLSSGEFKEQRESDSSNNLFS